MLSKAQIKWIQQLAQKKHRKVEHLFVAEGHKTVEELLPVFHCKMLCYTTDYKGLIKADKAEQVSYETLCKISRLETPQEVLAVFEMPELSFSPASLTGHLVLALDGIQDAGNMGTIIRLADWFGIETIVCSNTTVDVYNPKVVQATMGAIARVSVYYVDLVDLLQHTKMPIYVTALDGQNLYEQELTTEGIIVMGNEGNGVSPAVQALATQKLFIPNFPIGRVSSESLNVGVASAIICAEFRRRQL